MSIAKHSRLGGNILRFGGVFEDKLKKIILYDDEVA